MPAPKGNQFYKLVKKPTGRPMKYTPDELWGKAMEYFEWVAKNPLYETKVFGNGNRSRIPKMRAMTEMAFCLYAEIQEDTFRNYKSNKIEYEEFFEVANAIAKVIYQQKFEGAAAEFLNASIIARDLGLVDKSHVENEVTGDAFIEFMKMVATTSNSNIPNHVQQSSGKD